MTRRSRDEAGAQIQLSKEIFNKLKAKHKEFAVFDEFWRYKRDEPGTKMDISVRKFSLDALQTLFNIYKEAGSQMGDRWVMGQIRAHINVITSKGEAKVESLRALESAIVAWVKKDIIRGWVFMSMERTGVLQAMQVEDVYYTKAVVEENYRKPAFVTMRMRWIEKNKTTNTSFSWNASDCVGKTVQELLTEKDCFHESADLIKLYDANEEQFLTWRKMLGEQFVGNGVFQPKGERWWDSSEHKMRGVRLIVDDRCDDIDNRNVTAIFMALDSDDEDDDAIAEQFQKQEDEDAADRYARVPLSFYIWCFNLSTYTNGWVHMDHMDPYVYRPELREKLILSDEHGDLIDTLTADMDVLMEDIISGKSGGTCILCQGKAGTGKTLTAEIYAEVIKRPLYRVHSGQLGTESGSVETALKIALDNATRWRAVLLIDEADVFVAERGVDLEKNAVIGVFLRVLEYYSGLLFMTTNRVDTIDEAILSRCIAVIKYDPPAEAERVKLWQTLGDVYGMKLVKTPAMAQKLAQAFNCTGRDIKGLIKLVTKYARHHKKEPTIEDFKRLAAFKGL